MSTGSVNLPFQLGSDSPPDGIPEDLRPAFAELYKALRTIRNVFHDYVGIGQHSNQIWSLLNYFDTLHTASMGRFYAQANEDIAYGYAVNITVTGAELRLQKANATNNTKPCHGFCTTLGGIATGARGEVILNNGLLVGVAGLTRGTRYFLSTTGGLLTTVAPIAAGNIEQALGLALDTSALLFATDFDFIQH